MEWQQRQQSQQQVEDVQVQPVIDISMVDESAVNAYVARVFGWMFIGLLVTALTTVGLIFLAQDPYIMDMLFNVFLFVVIAELALVWAISARVTKMNPTTAKLLFLLYAAMNGLTFGFIAVLYAYMFGAGMHTIGLAFGITAVSFGIMAVFGLTTNRDLTRMGNLAYMMLFGLIIAMVANWFMGSGMVDFLICVVGLILFMGITAYKTNAIKHHYAQVALSENGAASVGARVDQEALASNLAISGALSLYLAFINMFMFILRLLARRR